MDIVCAALTVQTRTTPARIDRCIGALRLTTPSAVMLGPDAFTLETLLKASPVLPELTPVQRLIFAAAATEEGQFFRCLQDCPGHPSSPEEEDYPCKPQAHHYGGTQLHQFQIGNPRDRENQKVKDKNVEATATALAAALTNAITGVMTHDMIDMEAAEQRGSISGQEIFSIYFNPIGHNKIG
ncbi:hypothetical protein CFIO01_07400 [Colletotrichum fioriniae PJ7]|uniref:Uncharacterized protein n=1 Tax=Colletotrichum fioriniae PJ7 TaxID=1445577 RepID=A0A010Q1S3_9PEZI|nr:hypothetical protein CFIO01_07400 [Colletotrichum fioriniae PJ7]